MASTRPILRLPPCPPKAVSEIEMARLRLRGPRLSDLDCAAAMWSDPAMTEFVGGRPLAREDVWRRLILGFSGHWALLGFGYWAVGVDAQGRGYASEAVRAAVAWGDAHFDGRRIACLIHPENAASLRVAEKAGYRAFARTTYKDFPAVVLRR